MRVARCPLGARLHLPGGDDAEGLPCARGHPVIFLGETPALFFAYLFTGVWFSSCRTFVVLPYVRQTQVFCGTCDLQIFALWVACLFILEPRLAQSTRFSLWQSLVYVFFLLWIMLLGLCLKILCPTQGHKDFLLCFP